VELIALRLLAFAVALEILAGCGIVPSLGTGGDGDAGAASASSASSAAGAAAGDGGAKGVDCITESLTGSVLCTGISTCPELAVDHDLYPDCGFRPGGAVLDLECACQTSLCPVGVAKTCAEAAALLSRQTESQVCLQIDEGRCTGGGAPAASPADPNCDKACASECGGAAGCIHLCGC
jgi:hypothetical protein